MAETSTIRLPGCYPITLDFSLAHWKPEGTHHGAKSMPAILAASFVRLGFGSKTHEGWRLWVYTRGGRALHFDLYIDKREARA